MSNTVCVVAYVRQNNVFCLFLRAAARDPLPQFDKSIWNLLYYSTVISVAWVGERHWRVLFGMAFINIRLHTIIVNNVWMTIHLMNFFLNVLLKSEQSHNCVHRGTDLAPHLPSMRLCPLRCPSDWRLLVALLHRWYGDSWLWCQLALSNNPLFSELVSWYAPSVFFSPLTCLELWTRRHTAGLSAQYSEVFL